MSDVIQLADYADDASYTDPASLLRAMASEYEAGELTGGQCVVITLDRGEGDSYGLGWRNAGMRVSEMIAALDVAQDVMRGVLLGIER